MTTETNRIEFKRKLNDRFERSVVSYRRSMPRNRVLMRVFRDVELVESLGSGMTRILRAYDRSIFEFTPSFLVVTFPLTASEAEPGISPANGATAQTPHENRMKTVRKPHENDDVVLSVLRSDPTASIPHVARTLNLSQQSVRWRIDKMKKAERIRRVGSAKGGHWEVVE